MAMAPAMAAIPSSRRDGFYCTKNWNWAVLHRKHISFVKCTVRIRSASRRDPGGGDEQNKYRINLNEYMVTLNKPLGIRFAQMKNSVVFVDALVKEGNADSCRLITVGDIVKKVGDDILEGQEFMQIMNAIKTQNEPVTFILERGFFPPHIQSLIMESKLNVNDVGENTDMFQVTATYTEEENLDVLEWTHGNFHLDEFTAAQSRAAEDLVYKHKFGLQYTKLTDHLYVGSCLENGEDIEQLKSLGITAILNLQTESEQLNWELDKKAIHKLASENNICIASCSIRDVDTVDLRRKLPLAVATLHRMLRLGHIVYVTCTSGLDRSPACCIGYLHWIQDFPLENALEFVTKLHPCGPDRPALVSATWDLIAMVGSRNRDGSATHAVQIVWNHGCKDGEDVMIVGDFKGEWNEPIKACHLSGPKYAVDLRLPQGKYHFKFIIGGQWRHSNSLPTERDRWGNVNNVIKVGGRASTRFDNPIQQAPTKDLITIRVIERPLTDEERFKLAFAARRMTFSICPLRLVPKFQV